MQAFLETEHSTPEQIRALADEISRISISHSPDHIDQLSKQIREKLREISNIDAILDETRGNKTVAGALQAKAEVASRRSEAIRNTTTAVREALNRAMAAQGTAKTAIADALNQIAVTRTDLGSANEETTSAETILTGTNTSLTQLETEIKGVRIQNLQITEQAKNAYADANKAQKQAADSQMATTELQKDFDTARQLLEKKQTGNEVSQNRAELLRKRATSLLQNTQRHRQTITQLIADMDASELKMAEYQRSLDEMNRRIDSVTFEIHRRLDFYATCDV